MRSGPSGGDEATELTVHLGPCVSVDHRAIADRTELVKKNVAEKEKEGFRLRGIFL